MSRALAYLAVLLAGGLPAVPAVAGSNYAVAPLEAERRLATGGFEVLEHKRTASGVAGAQVWKIRFADGTRMKVKWKASPRFKAEGWNNSPRREVAAYEIQKLFLDPDDFVVPPTEVRCIPLALYRTVDPDARATFRRTDCVFGAFSSWLQDVEEPGEIWQPALFEQGGYYRFSIGAIDVLTLLIGHRDGRPANFLWANDPGRRHVFSIDNGISFDAFPWNPLVRNWNGLRVPALPRSIVERLDRVGADQLARLAVMRNLVEGPDGVLRPAPAERNLDPTRGSRIAGATLQIGLTERELGEVVERIGHVLHLAESGKMRLF